MNHRPIDADAPIHLSRPVTYDRAQLLTALQVADLLSTGTRTVQRMVDAGLFPQPLRYNRKLVRWRYTDVLAWVERGSPERGAAHQKKDGEE